MRRPRGCCAACWTSRPVRSAFNLDARGLGVCHWPARPGQSPIRTGYAHRRHWRMAGIPLARCIERMHQRHDFFGCRRAAELDAGAPQQGLGIAPGAHGLEQQMEASHQRPPTSASPSRNSALPCSERSSMRPRSSLIEPQSAAVRSHCAASSSSWRAAAGLLAAICLRAWEADLRRSPINHCFRRCQSFGIDPNRRDDVFMSSGGLLNFEAAFSFLAPDPAQRA